MDAGLLGAGQILVGTAFQPSGGYLFIVESNCADGAGGISFPAGFGTGRILAEQAARGFFV
jgi:hypothetical protein